MDYVRNMVEIYLKYGLKTTMVAISAVKKLRRRGTEGEDGRPKTGEVRD